MTPRKNKRQIKKALEDLRDDGPTDIEVTSSVVTITEDMTDESGNLIDESVPGSEPSEGYTRGEQLAVQSDVVDVWSTHMD